jgi:hypothetical protein
MTKDTLSNLAYPLAGGYAAHAAGLAPADIVFALLMLAMGVTSWYYHAGGEDGNHWDVGTMYAIGLYVWSITLIDAWLTMQAPAVTIMLVVFVLGLSAIGAFWLRIKQLDVKMESKIGGLFFVVYGAALLFTGLNPYVMASLGLIIVALLVRPKAHWVWHLLSAPALALLWIGVRI